MRIKTVAFLIHFIGIVQISFAQYQISGFIRDNVTGEKLIGANICETGTNHGTTTNNYGYFSLACKNNLITISYIGYSERSFLINKDTTLNIFLPKGKYINEIIIRGNRIKKFNTATLNAKELKNIPSLGGKSDIIKALQLQPGIQTQNEGTSLLNVRGGNPGENLYLLDNIPLIYVHHLGGFMSVFNPDMINNLEVYKGGFPSRFGGKLSSIVAITQKEGNFSNYKGNIGIGLSDISFLAEGPLFNKKASFICSGRKTIIDPLMMLVSGLSNGNDFYTLYGFHDFNGKFSWNPNLKNSFHLNLYQGDDYFKFWGKSTSTINEQSYQGNTWGNWILSARWNRVISSKMFVDNSISYSKYRLNFSNSYTNINNADTISYANSYCSSVQDISLRSDWQYKLLKNWNLRFGTKATKHIHIPNLITHSDKEVNKNERVLSNKISLYLSNQIYLLNFIDATIGGRFVNYYSSNTNQFAFEPRAALNFIISNSHILNFSFHHVNQFAHLVFTTGNIMNNEVWIPVDKNIKPSNSDQFSIGWQSSFFDNNILVEINAYHKSMNQLATYKEGYTNLIGDGGWRSKIESGGIGTSKGLELLLKKEKGNFTGTIGYTYSHTTRTFPGINEGKTYLYEYDRPHSLSIYSNYKLNPKWSFNASFQYQTGLPYTPVIGRQLSPTSDIDENGARIFSEVFIFGERNSDRLKDYHRLDLGILLTTKTKKGRKAEWYFSIYNAYNRQNPSNYYYGYNIDGSMKNNSGEYKQISQYQISYFPVIPSISYKLFFE